MNALSLPTEVFPLYFPTNPVDFATIQQRASGKGTLIRVAQRKMRFFVVSNRAMFEYSYSVSSIRKKACE